MKWRSAGFTLIEMLVALTLVALMSVAMIEAYRFSQRALAQTTRVDGAIHDVATTQRLLRRVLEAAYPFEPAAGSATSAPRESPRGLMGSSTGFSVSAPAPAQTGGVGLYRYALELLPSGALQMDWTTDRNGIAAEGELAPRHEALLTGVESISIEYLELIERGNGEIEPFWRETWIDKSAPPALVRIRVKFPAGDRRVWPELVVAPRISADANCVFDVVSQMCRIAA
jgi:general secretion pathway protein J